MLRPFILFHCIERHNIFVVCGRRHSPMSQVVKKSRRTYNAMINNFLQLSWITSLNQWFEFELYTPTLQVISAICYSVNMASHVHRQASTWTNSDISGWRHQMETFAALLTLCEENTPFTGGFPSPRPVTRRFKFLFDLRLDKRLSKQSRRWWFETPSRSLWRHCNVICAMKNKLKSESRYRSFAKMPF